MESTGKVTTWWISDRVGFARLDGTCLHYHSYVRSFFKVLSFLFEWERYDDDDDDVENNYYNVLLWEVKIFDGGR